MHINAGVAGLVLALLLGKRLGFGKEPMKPHNLTLTMIGAGLLWFGWFGFNVGSIVLGGESAPRPTPAAVHHRDRPGLAQHHRGHLRRDAGLAAGREDP